MSTESSNEIMGKSVSSYSSAVSEKRVRLKKDSRCVVVSRRSEKHCLVTNDCTYVVSINAAAEASSSDDDSGVDAFSSLSIMRVTPTIASQDIFADHI